MLQIREASQRGRDAAGQGVAAEVQPPEKGQVSQPPGDRAAQVVLVEVQPPEAHQTAQLARDRPGQLVVEETQQLESHEASQLAGDRTRQVVPADVQHLEPGEVPQPRRNRAGQRVRAQEEPVEAREVLQLARDRSGQRVVAELQPLQVLQAPQGPRDGTGQPVLAQVQPLEARQAAQHRRDRAGEAVVGEIQPRDATGGVRRHPVPLVQRRRQLPAGAVRPVLAAGRVVERLEHLAVVPRAGRRVDGHDQGLVGAQAVRIARGHRDRRRTGRPRREPDGVVRYEDANRAGVAGHGRVRQRVFVRVAEMGLHRHAEGRPRLGQRLGRDRVDGLGGAIARVAGEVGQAPGQGPGQGGSTRGPALRGPSGSPARPGSDRPVRSRR